MTKIDMIGEKCGQLEVTGYVGTNGRGRAMWRCRCVCGANRVVSGGEFRSGRVTSCGNHSLTRRGLMGKPGRIVRNLQVLGTAEDLEGIR